MTTKSSCLEIRVHLVDGSVCAYAQSDPDANKNMMEGFEPLRLFSQPYFAVESIDGVTVFPCSKIARVEMFPDPDPGWVVGPRFPNTRVREVTRADLERALTGDEGAELIRKNRAPGENFHGFVVLMMADAAEVVIEIQTRVAFVPDQKLFLEMLSGLNTMFFPGNSGGYVFVNTANLMRMNILPGQPDIAPRAWRAEPVSDYEME
ncbi:hypothetical protein LLG95_12535 [bacterium]|nr:hypothetical protein [bacterium]